MKNIVKTIISVSLISTIAFSYEVANIGTASTMVCSYTKTYKDGKWTTLPEFERKTSYMKVKSGGKVIVAPKGTRYKYSWVADDGIMRYHSTNGKYKMVVHPTERAYAVNGTTHNYTKITVGNKAGTKFAVGSCMLQAY